jgi:hypothetical protein
MLLFSGAFNPNVSFEAKKRSPPNPISANHCRMIIFQATITEYFWLMLVRLNYRQYEVLSN